MRTANYACRLLAVALLVFSSGCADELNTDYGSRTGIESTSINGTTVLADMFTAAGYRVSTASSLGPNLRKTADTIVWFPDDFQPPSVEVREWLESWLCDRPHRTLIYVDRDYQATAVYWQRLAESAPAGEQPDLKRRAETAAHWFVRQRPQIPERKNAGWFRIRNELAPRKVRTLSGSPAWLSGIDPAKTEIELNGRLRPIKGAEVLLASESDPLVMALQKCDSQLLVVANGSFLLNMPLVNHEHRKLAGKLIDQVGSPGRAVFLESGPAGVKIYDEEPKVAHRTGLEIFGVEPFDQLFLQLAAAGAVFCFSRLPIFGRPQPWAAGHLSDFGQHVRAFGKLLAATRDRSFADERLLHYQQTCHPDGKSIANSQSAPLRADKQNTAQP